MTLRQEGAANRLFLQKLLSYEADGVEVLKIVSSVWQNQRFEWSKVVLFAIEVSPVGSKPPSGVDVCISKGRHVLGAPAPLPTKASFLEQGRAGGPGESPPKLVEQGRDQPASQSSYLHTSLELL